MTPSRGSLGRGAQNSGSALIIVIMVIVILGLFMPYVLQSFSNRNRTQLGFRHGDAVDSIVQAVASKALGELRDHFGQYCPPTYPIWCNPRTMVCPPSFPVCNPFPQGPPPPTVKYTPGVNPATGQTNHRVFGKGDPAFRIELFQFGGNPFVPARFLVPETDPEAWIDRFGAGVGGSVMPLRVTFSVCRVEIAGRVAPLFPYNLAIPWPTTCPPQHVLQVSYTGLIPLANLPM